jgi:hypothetical protein
VPMKVQSPTLIATRFLERMWNQRDRLAIVEFRSTSAVSNGLGQRELTSADAYAKFIERAFVAFPKTKVSVLDSVESGHRVALFVRWEASTKHGGSFVADGVIHASVEGGKLVSAENLFNLGAICAQLGAPPYGTIAELIEHLG